MTRSFCALCILYLCFLVQNTFGQRLILEAHQLDSLVYQFEYPKLVKKENGKPSWQKEFSYADSLDFTKIKYNSDGHKVTAYLVAPKAAGTYPCIIYNRGGNRSFGSLNDLKAITMLGRIAKEGYLVIRGHGENEGEEVFGGTEINDILTLFDVLKEIAKADTSAIGMFGGSRGGMMTYRSLTKTNRLKAAAVLGAPSDQFALLADRPSMRRVFEELVPQYHEHKEDALRARSAIYWVDQFPQDVPILVMHGSSDWRVKSTQSIKLALEFEKYRIPYRLLIFEGGDHGLSEHRAEFFEALINWFDRFLKQEENLPNMKYHGP